MAARGTLQSGAYDTGLGDVEMQRAGGISNFMANLPFMEREARLKNMGGALGLLTGWAGAGPQGRTFQTTGESTGTTKGTTTMDSTEKKTGTTATDTTQTTKGPGFGKSIAQIGGGILLDEAARRRQAATPQSTDFATQVQNLPYDPRRSTGYGQMFPGGSVFGGRGY